MTDPVAGSPRQRLAALAVVAAAAVAGSAFSPAYVSGALVLPLLAAVLPVIVAVVLLGDRRADLLRPLLAGSVTALAVVLSVEHAVRLDGDGGVVTGVVDGWARLLATLPPAPARGDLVLFVPLLTALAALVGAELALRLPRGGPALLPPLLLVATAEAFAPASTARALVTGALLAALAAVVLATRAELPGGDAEDPGRSPASRLLAGLADRGPVAIATVLGIAVVAPVLTGVLPGATALRPYQLRDHRDPPVTLDSAPNPLDAVRLFAIDTPDGSPDDVALTVTGATSRDAFRVATLDTFDGASWTTSSRYRALGARVPADPDSTAPLTAQHAHVVVGRVGLPWLPVPDRVQELRGAAAGGAAVDPASAAIIGAGETAQGSTYDVGWGDSTVTQDQLMVAGVATGDLTRQTALPSVGRPASLTAQARQVATGSAYPAVQAAAIAQFLSGGMVDNGKTQPGDGWAAVQRLLVTRLGSRDQFAAAFVLLARAVGLPARIAVGFEVPPGEGGDFTVLRRDLTAWAEVDLAGAGWVRFEPAPDATSNAGGGGGGAAAAARALTQDVPSSIAPPQQVAPPVLLPPRHGRSTLAVVATVVLGVVLLVGLVLLCVPLAKLLRRRRRRRQLGPAAAVAAAWREARDALADARVPPDPAKTPREIAVDAEVVVPAAGPPVRTLARLLDETGWAGVPAPESGDAAWEGLAALLGALRARPYGSRVRSALDPGTFLRPRA